MSDNLAVMEQAQGENWALYNGDSADVLRELPDHSIDLSVFSPPFSSLYTYSPSVRDLGNVSDDGMFFEQFGYITKELVRVLKPGRLAAIHVANIPQCHNTHGYSGRKDFRGDVIRHLESQGMHYHSEITISKNPQAQAIRTKSKGLLFAQLNRDARGLWQAWADYVVVMRAPGTNDTPVVTELSSENWIDWANPVWPAFGGAEIEDDQASVEWSDRLAGQVWEGIRETDVLGGKGDTKPDNDDEKHLCPLQLPVIERCVKLWSNRGETVLSPFAGIGSEGVGAVRLGRKFVGVELKPAYYRVAKRNLTRLAKEATQGTLLEELAA
ncbi:MAG: site-specific DNA-methyltransferase [Promicromonosporaceae bacterium]|nr:site-specific DNA-methyltransferase [Promicromonosporaceae bacterium]